MSVDKFREANPTIEEAQVLGEYTVYLAGHRKERARELDMPVDQLHFLRMQKPEEDAPTVAVS